MKEIDDVVVMVIEDDELNAVLIKKMLEIIGVKKIVICESGKEARREAVKLEYIDLVLLDLRLPEEDGFHIIKSLRYLPGLEETCIIAATANIMPSDLSQAEEAGFDGFLGKPFQFDRFKSQITRILEGERVWEPR